MREGYKQTKIGEIPESWEVQKINEFANVTKLAGFEFTEYFEYVEDGEIIALRALNAKDGKLVLNDVKRVTREVSDNLLRSKLYKNDIVFTYVGTIGEVAIIKDNDTYHLAPNIAKITIKENKSPDYLYHYLRSHIIKSEIRKFLTTTSQPALSMGNIRELSTTFPPLPEQQKIAEILTTVDDKIDVIDQQICETQDLKKGLMQRLLTKGIGHTKFKDSPLGEIPESWEVVNVDDFLIDKKGAMKIGPFGSALKKDTFVPEGIKVYGQENIFENDMTYGDRYITNSHYKKLKSCELFEGDFIISMMGTIGKCMVVPEGIEKGIMDSHLLRLQLNSDLMDFNFLKHLFRSPLVLNQVNNLAVGGIMDGLSSKIVKQIKFVLPKIAEQKNMASFFDNADEKLVVLSEKKIHYQDLKKGLMQQLLTGKIRVNGLIDKNPMHE